MNECLTTPQHNNTSTIGCQTNGVYYLIRQDIAVYEILIKFPFFKYRTREIKTTETNKLLTLIEMAAWQIIMNEWKFNDTPAQK